MRAQIRTGAALTAHLSGFIRIAASSLDDALKLLAGNPVFEAGGTVEIRELPPSRFEAISSGWMPTWSRRRPSAARIG